MASALVSAWSGPGLSSDQGHYFLGSWAESLLSQCPSPLTLQMGTGEFNAGGNPTMN